MYTLLIYVRQSDEVIENKKKSFVSVSFITKKYMPFLQFLHLLNQSTRPRARSKYDFIL